MHEYKFENHQIDERNRKFNDMETEKIWNEIIASYSEQPRDVLTAGKRKYFYVYTQENDVYIESGRNHKNASEISSPRLLDKEELSIIYNKYIDGEKASDIKDITWNSVYWFGIFADLKL